MISYHYPALLAPFALWRPLGYLAVFVGMVFEGDAALFTAAFLTHQGLFDVGDMALVVFAGVFVGDLLWYQAGIWLSHTPSYSFVRRWLERITARFDSHLSKRLWHTLFVSKFAYGLHHPILMRAGAIGVPPRRFLGSDILATLLWVAIVGALGYGASASGSVLHRLRFAERTFLFGLIIFFLIEWLIRRNAKRRA